MTPLPLMRNTTVIQQPADQVTLTQRYTQEALSFIRAHNAQPFFLYLAYTSPHVPLFASPQFAGRSARGPYGDVVEEIDWSVGQILKVLKEQNIDRNSLVMFTSDNGPWLEKGAAGGTATPLRAGKGTVYEGGMRVPFVARWPARIPAGRVSNAAAMGLDIYPPLVNVSGNVITHPINIDGKNILGLLTGEAGRGGGEFLYYSRWQLRAFRSGNWNLHLNETLQATELYNLSTDIGEETNVIGREIAVRDVLTVRARHLDGRVPRDAPRKR
jgi:arylsulfatase A-like enzyme